MKKLKYKKLNGEIGYFLDNSNYKDKQDFIDEDFNGKNIFTINTK